jgi:hypothetical protein
MLISSIDLIRFALHRDLAGKYLFGSKAEKV